MAIMSWNPSELYTEVAEANRKSYDKDAERYDETTACMVFRRLQSILQQDLDQIFQMMPAERVRALDACGGSGNAALKMLQRGADVTLCDISPELIRVFQEKCGQAGFSEYRVACSEVGSYLAEADDVFDLIVFSSALHHIEDYVSVLKMAAERLAPGGFIYTVFDPARFRFPSRQITTLDYSLYRASKRPQDILPAIRKRVRRLSGRSAQQVSSADRDGSSGADYEYHVRGGGIDDVALAAEMEKSGLEKIWHERYPEAIIPAFRLFLRLLGQETRFKLLLKKPLALSE